MMSEVVSLLNELRGRGLRVTIAGPNLRIVPKPDDTELVDRLRAHKAELMALLKEQTETERCARLDSERNERDRQAGRDCDYDKTAPSHARDTPAGSLIRTCLEYGVGLRVEADGTLVVASNGKAWRSLIDAIEAHVDEVAALILSGWSPYDG